MFILCKAANKHANNKQEGDNDLGVAADLGAEKEVPHKFSGGRDL